MNEYYKNMEEKWKDYPSMSKTEEVDKFYQEMGYKKSVQKIIDDLMIHIPHEANIKILDFGCDNGIMLNYFRKYSDDLHGMDINEKSIIAGKKLFPEFNLKKNEGLNIDANDDTFDLIFLSAVLKHIRHEDRQEFYKELKRVGKYFIVFELNSDTDKTNEEQGFTFYHSNFEKELQENFIEIHSEIINNEIFAIYTK